jgi:hypothetical protein
MTGETYVRKVYPLPKNSKPCNDKGLQDAQKRDYKPAYKNFSKTAEGQPSDLPADLTEVVTVWTELPVHIKAAIKALVQTHTLEKK